MGQSVSQRKTTPYRGDPYGRAILWARIIVGAQYCGRAMWPRIVGVHCGRALWARKCGREHATLNYCCIINTAMWVRSVGGAQCGRTLWVAHMGGPICVGSQLVAHFAHGTALVVTREGAGSESVPI
jgi:hypothetical protein